MLDKHRKLVVGSLCSVSVRCTALCHTHAVTPHLSGCLHGEGWEQQCCPLVFEVSSCVPRDCRFGSRQCALMSVFMERRSGKMADWAVWAYSYRPTGISWIGCGVWTFIDRSACIAFHTGLCCWFCAFSECKIHLHCILLCMDVVSAYIPIHI